GGEARGGSSGGVAGGGIAGWGLPVVGGVAQETDVTVAALAADRRALTPSEAGEVGVPDAREVAQQLDRLGDRLARAGRDRVAQARARLEGLSGRAGRAARRALDDRRHRLAPPAPPPRAPRPPAALARGPHPTP